jgi:hypothetical protein
MWPVQVAREARTTDGHVTKLAGLGVQIAKVQSTFRARLPGGPVAPKSLIRTENDSAGHNSNLDASGVAAGLGFV